MPHALDRVIWEALSSRHRALGYDAGAARRYHPDVAPFGATADQSAASYRALRTLLEAGESVALFTPSEVAEPDGLAVTRRALVEQMVLAGTGPELAGADPVTLGAADIPAMMALAEMTRPGPFGPRTFETGPYLGIKSGGKLVAMTGERMRLEGYSEISAVCVDPAARGRGLAAALVSAVARGILARGETPFLHVFASNTAAIALYRKLGFVRRCGLHLAALQWA